MKLKMAFKTSPRRKETRPWYTAQEVQTPLSECDGHLELSRSLPVGRPSETNTHSSISELVDLTSSVRYEVLGRNRKQARPRCVVQRREEDLRIISRPLVTRLLTTAIVTEAGADGPSGSSFQSKRKNRKTSLQTRMRKLRKEALRNSCGQNTSVLPGLYTATVSDHTSEESVEPALSESEECLLVPGFSVTVDQHGYYSVVDSLHNTTGRMQDTNGLHPETMQEQGESLICTVRTTTHNRRSPITESVSSSGLKRPAPQISDDTSEEHRPQQPKKKRDKH
ncbi:uncharacterized protein LOC143515199 [Brachyhypopomus gauderio]|uniref:uncharacterized protein LOC143515199 n=1 Tax=Brachyhypopomus gauderio TaxID=698409 RepID=UPI004042DFEB